jgi:probable HAF family extracellular repeat protein
MNNRVPILSALLLSFTALAIGSPPQYKRILIPVQQGHTVTLHGLNNVGQVLGTECDQATLSCTIFLWTEYSGRRPILSYVEGAVISLFLNDRGHVAMTRNSGAPSYLNSVELWAEATGWRTIPELSSAGSLTNLDIILAGPLSLWFPALGVRQIHAPVGVSGISSLNTWGMVAGTANLQTCDLTPCPSPCRAFAWTPWSGFKDLGIPQTGGWIASRGLDVNDLGDVTGILIHSSLLPENQHVFLWSALRGMEAVGPCWPGTCRGDIMVNNRREIAGSKYSDTAINVRTFHWSRSTGMRDIGHLGGGDAFLQMFNDRGEIVGESNTSAKIYHAFIWSIEKGMIDLTPDGWGIAKIVNNSGLVMGISETGLCLWKPVDNHR